MKKTNPKLYGYIRLLSRKSTPDVIKIDDNFLFIINSCLYITSPLNHNRGLVGLFHIKYKHKCNILSACKIKMDFSFCTDFFQGPGSYDFSDKEEVFWLIFDAENNFTLISSSLCTTVTTFTIPNITGITNKNQISICGLKEQGIFAVRVPGSIFICHIRKKEDPEIFFEEKTMAIRIAPYIDGLLILSNNSLSYYSKGKISNFYNSNHVSDFIITKNNNVTIIQKNDRNVVFHTIQGATIGMAYVKLYTVLDDWAVSICHGRHVVIANINDKNKGMEFSLTGQVRASVISLKAIYADYFKNDTSKMIIIIITTRKILFIKVSLDRILNAPAEDTQDQKPAEDKKQEEEMVDYEYFEEEEEEEEEEGEEEDKKGEKVANKT